MQHLPVKIMKSISDLTPKEIADLLKQYHLSSNHARHEDSEELVKKPEMIGDKYVYEINLNTASMSEIGMFQNQINDDRIVQFWDQPAKDAYEQQHKLETKALAGAMGGGIALLTTLSVAEGPVKQLTSAPIAHSISGSLILAAVIIGHRAKKWANELIANQSDIVAAAEMNADNIKADFKEMADAQVIKLNKQQMRKISNYDEATLD